MREVGGELRQGVGEGRRGSDWKQADLSSYSSAATFYMASRPLASSLLQWGLIWEDYKEAG